MDKPLKKADKAGTDDDSLIEENSVNSSVDSLDSPMIQTRKQLIKRES